MKLANTTLADYFNAELAALRGDAAIFARNFPAAAGALGLSQGRSTDPQVELLVQSFAFLAGRLRYQLDLGQASLPNALTDHLYPHLSAPLPSMTIAALDVKPDGANFAKRQLLERKRLMTAKGYDMRGNPVACRFMTCYDTPLVPLVIDSIQLVAPSSRSLDSADWKDPNLRSVLSVTLRRTGTGTLSELQLGTLRFYLNCAPNDLHTFYEMLALGLAKIVAQPLDAAGKPAGARQELPAAALTWRGFAQDEAMLEVSANTHPGYRLLQEYFAFPEKFLFFDVEGLAFASGAIAFDLMFIGTQTLDVVATLPPDLLRLNCVPLINLYPQRLEPIALDHTRYEYRLQGNAGDHRYCEVYSLTELYSTRPGDPPRTLAPYFSMDDFQRLQSQDYFYMTRREESQLGDVQGTELYVSFLDATFNLAKPADESLGGAALCTNRNLPEQLRQGDPLRLEGAGPISGASIVSPVTSHQTPRLIGARPWALAAQLALNRLSLADGPHALAALKDLLKQHVGMRGESGFKQIDGIRDMRTARVMVRRGDDAWRGFVDGLRVDLWLDRASFAEGSVILFGEVLRHFFALYGAVNAGVALRISVNDIKGVLREWPQLVGLQPVL
ncbi:type VI secretion system baseplate subunit TssF [Paraburkholderia sediminicola]|uniref:type VI secretion system baseplate subunit TssF n=1 Tax=Paraburkholderia TaxID=1822464 RepID=UPI0038B97ACC